MTVGQLEHQAAVTELYLFSAFRVLVGCDASIARAIYYTFDSFNGRSNLLKRISEANSKCEPYIKRLIKSGTQANELRRKVAHAMFSCDITSLDAPVNMWKIKSMTEHEISHDYLDGLMGRSSAALNDTVAAFEDLCAFLDVPAQVQVTDES
jgi:hypothetical protein